MSLILTSACLALVIALVIGVSVVGRARRRQHAVTALLNAADALELRLRTARSEIEAVVESDADPVREALQEMLRQRLWLQQHGERAPLAELNAVRASIDAARANIERQLADLAAARSRSRTHSP